MALPDLTGQNIQDTYQRVLQVGDDGFVRDGTGSLAPILYMTASYALSASVEITHEVSSSHAQRADFADAGNFISASSQIATEISGAFFAPSASFSTRVTANDAKVTNTDQSLVHLAVTGSDVLFGDITASGNISSSGTLYGTGLDILGPSNSHISVGEYNVGHDIANLEGLRITGSGLIISGAMADANHHNMLKIGNVELLDLNTNYGGGAVTSTGEFLIHNVSTFKITSGSDGGDVAGNAGRLLEHNGNDFIIYKNNIAAISSTGLTTSIADTNISINASNCSIRAVNDTPGYIMGFASNPNNAPGVVSSIAVASLGELVGNLANPTITQAAGEFGEGLLTINATSFAYNSSISFQRAEVQGWKVGTGGAGAQSTSSFHIQGGLGTSFTGNTNGLYITSSNYNVGIGTQDPTEKLTVAGNISASAIIVAGDVSGSVGHFNAVEGFISGDGTDRVLTSNGDGTFTALNNLTCNGTTFALQAQNIDMQAAGSDGFDLTGNITASGNISASGNVIAPNLSADSASFSARVGLNDAKVTNSDQDLSELALTANISGSFFELSASFSTRVGLNDAKVTNSDQDLSALALSANISGSFFELSASLGVRTANSERNIISLTTTSGSLLSSIDMLSIVTGSYAVTGSDVLFGAITASGDISASGFSIICQRGQFSSQVEVNGEVALSTEDSATTGKVFADTQITKIKIGKAGAITSTLLESNVTASGNISASGHVYGQAGLLVYNTSSIAGTAQGDIIKFGDVPTIPGLIYAHTGSGWTLAHSGSNGHASSSLGLAVGSNSSADGMLLRGMTNIGYEPGGLNGCALYLESPGSASNNVPSVSGDVARVIGWNFGGDTVYFTPDNTWVEIA